MDSISLVLLFISPILGWFAGGVVNYLADVLPFRRRLSTPFCLKCEASVHLLAYLAWPSPCRQCGARRAFRSWLVQVFYACAAIGLWFLEIDLGILPGMILLMYLGVVSVIDIEHRLILHVVSAAGALLAFVFGTWQHGLVSTLGGGLAGFLFTLAFYYFGILFVRWSRRLRGQETLEDEGLGFGDVNLSGVLGLLLGWPGIIAGLILAVVLGGIVSLVYLLVMLVRRRYSPDLSLPYGPFLVLSAILLIYFQEYLVALM